MNLHLMLMLLSFKEPKRSEPLGVLPAPQITCPLTLEEYSLSFRWWARKEVIQRQWILAQESRRELVKRQI